MGFRNSPKCCFCDSQSLRLIYHQVSHGSVKSHGPFDIYKCLGCGSGVTFPLPSSDSLSNFYAAFHSGLPEFHRQVMEASPQDSLYGGWFQRLVAITGKKPCDSFSWIDVGAGGGEMAFLMATGFPNSTGVAVDLHRCPPHLENLKNLRWEKIDLNSEDFDRAITSIVGRADVVYATGVLEHVRHPDKFVASLLNLLKNSSYLYLLCPNFGSIAFRILRTRWPYFTPGEHLNMPTLLGARKCLQGQIKGVRGDESSARIAVRPLLMRYTVGYVLGRIGLLGLTKWKFLKWICAIHFPMPAGALEASLTFSDEPSKV